MAKGKSSGGGRVHVTPKGPKWQVKPEGQPVISQHSTQSAAEKAAKQLLRQTGGGEAVIHRPDGRIRDSDTIDRQDPNPPKDTKH